MDEVIPIQGVDLSTNLFGLSAQVLNGVLQLPNSFVLLENQHVVFSHYELDVLLDLVRLLVVLVDLLEDKGQGLDVGTVDVVQLFQKLFLF